MMMMMMKTHAPLVNGIVNKLCAWRHNMPPSPASWQYLFARWHLFRHVGYLRHQHQVDLWPFDLESRVRIACDVGYLCANFSLPRPLCSRVRPDVRDRQTDRQTDRRQTDVIRQTDVRQKHRLMPPPYGGGGIITIRSTPAHTSIRRCIKSFTSCAFCGRLDGKLCARFCSQLDWGQGCSADKNLKVHTSDHDLLDHCTFGMEAANDALTVLVYTPCGKDHI